MSLESSLYQTSFLAGGHCGGSQKKQTIKPNKPIKSPPFISQLDHAKVLEMLELSGNL